MRRTALVVRTDEDVKRVVLYASDEEPYLFLSRLIEGRGSFADEWYPSTKDAVEACRKRFGIEESMWHDVPDPEPGCQHDWIAPVRVKRTAEGKPIWGVLERLVDGEWIPNTESSE